MKGEPGVIDFLNKALRHELTAINQYWLHYRLLDNWGYKVLGKQWRKESIEEMEHADKLVDRIIFLDGFPNMQVLDPLHIGQNVKEVLDCDLAAEMSARALYEEAATHCHSVRLRVPRPVREADARRGRPHRFPRNPTRPRRQTRPRALCPAPYRRA
jgi:bacterioferritin